MRCCAQVLAEIEVSTEEKKMKRLILLLVLVLHSILFYNDYRSASALTNAAAESTYFSPNRYFQLEKENEIFTDDEWSLLRRSKGDRRGWVKI